MNLATAIAELQAHAREHPWNPLDMKQPEYRDCEHEGARWRFALSRVLFPADMRRVSPTGKPVAEGQHVYMVSICKLSAVPDERGYCLPTSQEGEALARAFFPQGFDPIPEKLDMLGNSLKYFAVL